MKHQDSSPSLSEQVKKQCQTLKLTDYNNQDNNNNNKQVAKTRFGNWQKQGMLKVWGKSPVMKRKTVQPKMLNVETVQK